MNDERKRLDSDNQVERLVRRFELNVDQFMEYSPVPLAVRMRMALNKMGMKFIDDGKLSVVWNENPVPLGKVTVYEEFSKPHIKIYVQELEA